MVGAVILAAGRGSRMGEKSKASLKLGDVTFLEHAIQNCRDGGCSEVWTVVSPDAEIQKLARSLDTHLVINSNPEQGMFSSVVLGLQKAIDVQPRLLGVMIYPVDHPSVSSDTVKRVASALGEKSKEFWLQPGYHGKGGHPIVIDMPTAKELVRLPPTRTLREALRSLRRKPHLVAVDDPEVLTNINTPGDLPE